MFAYYTLPMCRSQGVLCKKMKFFLRPGPGFYRADVSGFRLVQSWGIDEAIIPKQRKPPKALDN